MVLINKRYNKGMKTGGIDPSTSVWIPLWRPFVLNVYVATRRPPFMPDSLTAVNAFIVIIAISIL